MINDRDRSAPQATAERDAFTTAHRLYFAIVAAFALWVGVWGYFAPAGIRDAIPWSVPPLHARFLGAMYLSGAAFMIGGLLARRWDEVRVVVPMVGIWTVTLCIVSLLHLSEFNFGEAQSWLWFGAYSIFPAIAFWLTWQKRGTGGAAGAGLSDRTVPTWVRVYLRIQGVVGTLLALALLVAPVATTAFWPWPITPLLAQLYGGPFIAYGVGSLLLARETRWPALRIAVAAMWVFSTGVLIASIVHGALFSASDLSDWLWFGAFSAATVSLGAIALAARRTSEVGLTGSPISTV